VWGRGCEAPRRAHGLPAARRRSLWPTTEPAGQTAAAGSHSHENPAAATPHTREGRPGAHNNAHPRTAGPRRAGPAVTARPAPAEAQARRDATAQWDRFIAAAHATPARARTDVQRAVVGAGLTAGGDR